jgi:uncharacterized delta-60 repeat protein
VFSSLRHRLPFAIADRKPVKQLRRARRCPGTARLSFERLEDRSLLSAGDLDLTFGGDGTVTTDLGSIDTTTQLARSVAVQADGKIVAAGMTTNSFAPWDFFLARYNADGSLDVSFGEDGKTTVDFGNSYDEGWSVAIDGSGRIIVGGVSDQGGATGFDFAVARLNDDGTLDTSFSGDGRATVDFGSVDDYGRSVAIDGSGRIVVVGTTIQAQGGSTGPSDFAIARLNDDGTLDTSFSDDGRATVDFGNGLDSGFSVAIDGSGRIIVGGVSDQGGATGYDFAIARLNDDGTLDTSFSGDGRATVDFGGGHDSGESVAVDGSGGIVVVGLSNQGGATGLDFAIARLEGGTDVLTPEHLIDDLDVEIDQLVTGGQLTEGQANSLLAKLQRILDMIDSGNWNAVVGKLEAFVDQVQAWDGTILTHEESQTLIALAELILEQQP